MKIKARWHVATTSSWLFGGRTQWWRGTLCEKASRSFLTCKNRNNISVVPFRFTLSCPACTDLYSNKCHVRIKCNKMTLNPSQNSAGHKKNITFSQWGCTGLPWCNIPTLSSFPKTVLSPRAEQFQRPCLNWNWHSLIPIWTPSPITMIASGRLWQIVLWRGAKPGILLQMMLAPRATTDDRPLRWRWEVKMWRLSVWRLCRCLNNMRK